MRYENKLADSGNCTIGAKIMHGQRALKFMKHVQCSIKFRSSIVYMKGIYMKSLYEEFI